MRPTATGAASAPFTRRTPQRSTTARAVHHALWLMLAAAPVAVHSPFAHAQAARPPGNTAADAASESTPRTYDIPAGPLTAALKRFGLEAGILLSFSTEQTSGRQTQGLSGRHTVANALQALLAGTELAAVRQESGGWLLVRRAMPASQPAAKPPSVAETVLPVVRVKAGAERETAAGPVVGYVAKRSVTGTKTDTPILETPQSMSVVGREELDLRKPNRIDEALQFSSGGIDVNRGIDLRYDGKQIRGFAAGIFLDGLRLEDLGSFGPSMGEPYGLERIEALRGPSSMLYGQTSPGGLVNMVSKRPEGAALHEVEVLFGSYGRKQIAGDFGGLADEAGELAFRLTGLLRRSDTEVEFVEDNRFYIAPSMTWKPSAATQITLLVSHLSDDAGHSGGTSAFLPASGIATFNPNGRISRTTYGGEPGFDHHKKTQSMAGYELEHRVDDTWSFRQVLRRQRLKLDYQTVYGLSSFADDAIRMYQRGVFGQFGQVDTLATDNQLTARWRSGDATHTTMMGLDYRQSRSQLKGYYGEDVAPIDIFSPVYGAPVTLPDEPYLDQGGRSTQLGAYVQDQIKFNARWLFTLGGRWDHARTSSIDHLASDARASQSDSKVTGRGAATYLFDNGVAPYLSYSTSFEPNIGSDWFGAPFKPTTGKQVEIGVKFQPQGGKSLYTASVFDIRQQKRLTSDPDQVNHPFAQVQAGEFRSRGLELEARAEVSRALSMMAAYTYLDARISKSNDGDVGARPHGVPRNSLAGWFNYILRGSDFDGLGTSLGVRYVGQAASDDAAIPLPAATVVDFGMHYQFGGYRVAFNIDNLFNKDTYDMYVNNTRYGQGRLMRASLSYRW